MNRRCLGLGLVLILGTLGYGAWLLMRPASLVMEDNFNRIQEGMTKAEVESILGKPDILEFSDKTKAGDTARFAMYVLGMYEWRFAQKATKSFAIAIWVADERHFVVSMSDDNKVNGTTMFTMSHPTLTERIRSWFGL